MTSRGEITSVTFRTTADPERSGSTEAFVAQLRARTVSHIDRVDVGALIGAYLEQYPEPDPGVLILRLTALVETALDQARTKVRTGTAADFAARLIPRLTTHKENVSDH